MPTIKTTGFGVKGSQPRPPYYDPDLASGRARPLAGNLLLLESWHAIGSPAGGWASSTNGAGSGVTSIGTLQDHPGIQRHVSGTTAAGRASTGTAQVGDSAFRTQSGIVRARASAIVRIPTLSDAVEEFACKAGLSDLLTGVGHTADGAAFVYNRAVNGVNWRCQAMRATIAEDDDSGIVVTAGAWVRLRIEIDEGGMRYFVDNALVAQQAIPTDNVGMSVVGGIFKSVGITTRNYDVDLLELEIRG